MTWSRERRERIDKEIARLAEIQRQKNRKRLKTMAIIAVAEAVLIAVFIIANMEDQSVPVNFLDQEGTLAAWKSMDFVVSIEDSSGHVIVNEDMWHDLPRTRRTAVRALLNAYLGKRSGASAPPIVLIGDRTHQVLPESGGPR